jgi:hypothetical protein
MPRRVHRSHPADAKQTFEGPFFVEHASDAFFGSWVERWHAPIMTQPHCERMPRTAAQACGKNVSTTETPHGRATRRAKDR